jgi:hypothetical protein
MKPLVGLVAIVLLCTNAIAGELDLSFNSDAFRFFYIHDFADNELQSDFGLLNDSDVGYVVNASLYITGMASDGENPLQAGIGGRTAIVDGDDSGQTGMPLALGGYVKYTLPNLNRVSIRVDAYYAPDILTLKDLDKYHDYTIRLGYNVLQNADIYVGARYVKGEFDNDTDVLFDNGMHVGVHIRF